MDTTRLATAIKERRKELRLSQQRAADLAGVHRLTWRAWENGSTPEDYNYAGIERALHWTSGSVASVLAGGAPAADDSEPKPPPLTDEQRELMEVYKFWEGKYGPDEALQRLNNAVDWINEQRALRHRQVG